MNVKTEGGGGENVASANISTDHDYHHNPPPVSNHNNSIHEFLHLAPPFANTKTPKNNIPTDHNTNNNNGVVIVYKECLKNHAAALGRAATDGCGEFMPSCDALCCSACGCHRNFHRKAMLDGGGRSSPPPNLLPQCPHWSSSIPIPIPIPIACHPSEGVPRKRVGSHSLEVRHPVGPTSTLGSNKLEEVVKEGGLQRVEGVIKKRNRTKFTKEQKEKMLGFAEKAGWKIQKLDEGLIQEFCEELGIKRRVLKVWMHNNKHHYVKKHTHSPAHDNNSQTNSPGN